MREKGTSTSKNLLAVRVKLIENNEDKSTYLGQA